MEAFPSIIGEIHLGLSLGNEVQRLPVTFLFKKWANSSVTYLKIIDISKD